MVEFFLGGERETTESYPIETIEKIWKVFPEDMKHLTGAFGAAVRPAKVDFFTELVRTELAHRNIKNVLISDHETMLFIAALRRTEQVHGVTLINEVPERPEKQEVNKKDEEKIEVRRNAEYQLAERVRLFLHLRLPEWVRLYDLRYGAEVYGDSIADTLTDMPESQRMADLSLPPQLTFKGLLDEAADFVKQTG